MVKRKESSEKEATATRADDQAVTGWYGDYIHVCVYTHIYSIHIHVHTCGTVLYLFYLFI